MADHEYWSPQQIVESGKYPFTIGQIRHLLLFRHRNGLHEGVWKIGKRLVLRIDLLDSWIESHNKPQQITKDKKPTSAKEKEHE